MEKHSREGERMKAKISNEIPFTNYLPKWVCFILGYICFLYLFLSFHFVTTAEYFFLLLCISSFANCIDKGKAATINAPFCTQL